MTQAGFGPRNDCPVGIWSIYFITLFSSFSLLSTYYICGIVVGIQMVEQQIIPLLVKKGLILYLHLFSSIFSQICHHIVFSCIIIYLIFAESELFRTFVGEISELKHSVN